MKNKIAISGTFRGLRWRCVAQRSYYTSGTQIGIVEVSERRDAMGQPVWTPAPQTWKESSFPSAIATALVKRMKKRRSARD